MTKGGSHDNTFAKPLTKTPVAPKASPPLSGLSSAIELWRKYKHLPLGAALGSSTAFAILLVDSDVLPEGWSRAWFVAAFGIGGVATERLLHWAFGRWVDPLLTHWGAKWSSRLSLSRLADFERRGLISKGTAIKLKDRIARKAIAGEPQPARNRPHIYRKRQPPGPPAPPPPPLPPA